MDALLADRKKKWEAEKERINKELKAHEAAMAEEEAKKAALTLKLRQPMLFQTKNGNYSVTGIFMASTFKHVRLKRVDNEKDVTVERSLLSDKTNALVKEKEELKRKLESSPDAKK